MDWDLVWGTALFWAWYWFVIHVSSTWGRTLGHNEKARKPNVQGIRWVLGGLAILSLPFVVFGLPYQGNFDTTAVVLGAFLVATAVYLHGISVGRKELSIEQLKKLKQVLEELAEEREVLRKGMLNCLPGLKDFTGLPNETTDIIGAYGGVLERQIEHACWVSPDSVLPYPKEEIRCAFVTALEQVSDATLRLHLQTGLSSLDAHFAPDIELPSGPIRDAEQWFDFLHRRGERRKAARGDEFKGADDDQGAED